MAKIAANFRESATVAGHEPGRGPASRMVARGEGWSVSDVVCGAGPHDRPFEERHSAVCVAIVREGSFQYRSESGRELMTPGTILLGNPGQHFECGHEHGVGDRCLSFSYDLGYFEEILAEAGVRNRSARFATLCVPPLRELSALVSRACAYFAECNEPSTDPCAPAGGTWEAIGVELAVRAREATPGRRPNKEISRAAEARVTRIVRMIESHADAQHSLGELALEARLSRFHFLRVFRQLTGLTPHKYVLRARLRRAATRLMLEPARVLDIAFDSGFGDISNFNHAFRAEFGFSPLSCRRKYAARP